MLSRRVRGQKDKAKSEHNQGVFSEAILKCRAGTCIPVWSKTGYAGHHANVLNAQ